MISDSSRLCFKMIKTNKSNSLLVIFITILIFLIFEKIFNLTKNISFYYNLTLLVLFIPTFYILTFNYYKFKKNNFFLAIFFFMLILNNMILISAFSIDLVLNKNQISNSPLVPIIYLAQLLVYFLLTNKKPFFSNSNAKDETFFSEKNINNSKYFDHVNKTQNNDIYITYQKNNTSNNIFYNLVSLISIVLFIVLMALIYLSHNLFIEFLHSSDASNVYYVYKNVVNNNISFYDIHTYDLKSLITLPYFLYFLAASFAGNFYFAQLLNALLQALLFLAVSFYLLRVIYDKKESVYLFSFIILSMSFVLVFIPSTAERYFDRGYFQLDIKSFYYPIWMPDYHFVQTSLLSLLSFAFFIHYLTAESQKLKKLTLTGFILTSLVGGAGNPLFVVFSTAPIILIIIYLKVIEKLYRNQNLFLIITCTTSLALQHLITKLISVDSGALSNYADFSFRYIRSNIDDIVSMFYANLLAQPLLIPCFFILLIRGIWKIIFDIKSLKKTERIDVHIILLAFLLASTICVITFLLMSKMVRERYTTGLLFYSLVIFVAIFGKTLLNGINKLKEVKMAISLIIIFFIAFQIFIFSKKEIYHDYYPRKISCIDSLASQYRFQNGAAPFELAHSLEMASKKNLTIAPTKDVFLYKFWLSEQDINKFYNFLLSSNKRINDHYHMDKQNILKYYGEPDFIEKCDELTVYIFNKPFRIKELKSE